MTVAIEQRRQLELVPVPRGLPDFVYTSHGDEISLQEVVRQRLELAQNGNFPQNQIEQNIFLQDIVGLWDRIYAYKSLPQENGRWRNMALTYTGGYMVEMMRQMRDSGNEDEVVSFEHGARAMVRGIMELSESNDEQRNLAALMGLSIGNFLSICRGRFIESEGMTPDCCQTENCAQALLNALAETDYYLENIPEKQRDETEVDVRLQIKDRPNSDTFSQALEMAVSRKITEPVFNHIHKAVDNLRHRGWHDVQPPMVDITDYHMAREELMENMPLDKEPELLALAVGQY